METAQAIFFNSMKLTVHEKILSKNIEIKILSIPIIICLENSNISEK